MEVFFINTVTNMLNIYNECLQAKKISSNKLKAYQKELIWLKDSLRESHRCEEISEKFYKEQLIKLINVDFNLIKDYKKNIK